MKTPFRRMVIVVVSAVIIPCVVMESAIIYDGLTDDLAPADAALVLGNKVNEDGTVSNRLRGRLDRAVALVESNQVSKVVVSGGLGREGYFEEDVMASYLRDKGIPEGDIIVDNDGLTTRSTAENYALISKKHGLKSVILVSQFFHISRARLALQKAGVENVGSAHSTVYEWRDIYATLREFPAYCKYLFFQ